jgi:hypothetical protein
MLSLLLSLLLTSQIQAPTGVVSGRIVFTTGKPSVGIRVSAMLAPDSGRPGDAADIGALFSQTQTDEAGRYRLENIPPGRYYIMAGRVDAPTYYPGRTDQLAATAISVASGTPQEGIDFTIEESSARVPTTAGGFVVMNQTPTVRIDVRFHAEAGSLIPIMSPRGRTQISAIATTSGGAMATTITPFGNFVVFPGTASASASIEPDGSMTLMVANGQYRFSVEHLPDDYEVKSMSLGPVDLLRNNLQVNGPVSSPLNVTVGLHKQPLRRLGRIVRGQVLDGITGKPWIAEAVYLSGTPGNVFADGSFEFRTIAGTYALEAREGPPGNRTAQGKVVVGTTDVTARLTYTSIPTHVRMTGRVIVDGSKDPARINSGRIVATGSSASPIAIAMDGTFKTALTEGDYQLSVEGFPPGLILKSISHRGVDLLAGPLRIQPRDGPALADIVVTLGATPRFGVRGRVIADPPTRPVEDAVVALTGGPERYATKAAADGSFELLSVLPGQYQITIQPFGFSNVTGTIVVIDQDLKVEFKSQPLY